MKTRALVLVLASTLLAGCLNRIAWLPDGRRLVYVQDGVAWLVALDGQRTKLGEFAGLGNPEVTAAPRGGWIAVLGRSGGRGRVTILTEAGTVAWTGTMPGEEAQVVPGAWSADGGRLLVWGGKSSLLVDPAAASARVVECGDAPRLDRAGDLVSLGAAGLARLTRAGAVAKTAWKTPAGIQDAVPLLLTEDAAAAWWKGKRGGKDVTVLAGADGRIVFSSTRTLTNAGPDSRSYVTDAGGYAIVAAGKPEVNLNPIGNALLRMDLNWYLVDPRAAEAMYNAEDLIASAPAFSPDGTRVAILTPRLLCVATLRTGEVSAIAKW